MSDVTKPASTETASESSSTPPNPVAMVESNHTVITYRCANSKCNAVDHDKVFIGGTPEPVINCWKCGAGRGLERNEQIMQRRGMFPVLPS